MSYSMEKNRAFFQRAGEVLPFGVTSNFRYWSEGENVGVTRAEGSYIWDFDATATSITDGFGPVILGHGLYAGRGSVVAEAIKNGTVYALTHELEVRVANGSRNCVARRPISALRQFRCRGDDARACAFARSHTGPRERSIKSRDSTMGCTITCCSRPRSSPLEGLGHRRSPHPVATSSGIPRRSTISSSPCRYNDFETLEPYRSTVLG